MSAITSGRILLTLVAFATSIGGYIADWNETHVFNPRWPPHAKFHNGQTLSMGLILGLTTLYYIYRPLSSTEAALSLSRATERALERRSVYTAAWIASLYWITQLSAFFYPGAKAMDPEFGEGAPQAYISAVLLGMVGLGIVLEGRRLGDGDKKEDKKA